MDQFSLAEDSAVDSIATLVCNARQGTDPRKRLDLLWEAYKQLAKLLIGMEVDRINKRYT